MQLKMAIILGAWSVGSRPLSFGDIFDNPRGLTGTDLSTVMIAKTLVSLGHDVSLFTCHTTEQLPSPWEGVKLYHIKDANGVINSNKFDAVISINEPDALREIRNDVLKICWHYLNDFSFCSPGYEQGVDLFLGVCEKHLEHLQKYYLKNSNCGVLPLGCDPNDYGPWEKKIPGRMIYCSSPDRGLVGALMAFPKIKAKVPEAHLKVFYHFQDGPILDIAPDATNTNIDIRELGHRLRFCKNAMERLKILGVEHTGSVSVNQMKKEMSEASLLIYPCEPVAFSEGFSLTIMQCHAAGVIPVISSADCLQSIYENSGCLMGQVPVLNYIDEYVEMVVKALKDQQHAEEIRKKCLQFSKFYNWQDISKRMEEIIISHPKYRQ